MKKNRKSDNMNFISPTTNFFMRVELSELWNGMIPVLFYIPDQAFAKILTWSKHLFMTLSFRKLVS